MRAAAPPALLAGLLWSAGNALAIVATQVLGGKPYILKLLFRYMPAA